MSLKDWAANGWLTEHRTSPEEITALLGVVDRDLRECRSPGLSPDWQLNIAYNAALQAGSAALAASGYRAQREQHHHRIIQSLAFTVGYDRVQIGLLDRFRKKRNIGGYERAGMVSQQEADEMKALAQQIREDVVTWLRGNHPGLVKG